MTGCSRARITQCFPYVIVAVPVVAEVVRKALSGWTPTSDDGAFAVNAHDVFTTHPNWLGAASTVGASAASGFHVFHLGPLQWWALAIPERFATQRMGLAIGAALVVAASVFGIVTIARRLGGPRAALCAAAVVAMTMWSVGHITLAEPWNPFFALWPFAFCLVAASEIASGDRRTLPWFALAASFTVQCHYLYLIPLGGATFVTLVWSMLRRFHWRQAETKATRKQRFTTAGVVVFAWLPSVVQQIRGNPGNLSEWWRATRSLSQSHVPFEYATHYLVQTVGGVPLFMRGPRSTAQLDLLGQPPSTAATIVAAIVIVGSLLFMVLGLRRRGESTDNHDHGALPAVALAALAGSIFTISRYPASFPAFPHYRIVLLWPVGALVWFGFASSAATRLTQRKPALFAGLSGRAITALSCLTAIAMAAAASVGASPPGPSSAVEQGATLHLTDQVLQHLNRNRHYVLAASGRSATFVQLGVLRELLRAEIPIGVSSDEVQLKSRYLVRDLHTVDRLIVASGTLTAPPRTTTVATFDGRGRRDEAQVRQRRQELLTVLHAHPPQLRPEFVYNPSDPFLTAIAKQQLTPEQSIDPRLLPLIAAGNVKVTSSFLDAITNYGQTNTDAKEREYVVYIEPA